MQYTQLAAGTSGGSHSNLGLKIGLPVAIGCVLALLLCCCCAFGCMVSGNSQALKVCNLILSYLRHCDMYLIVTDCWCFAFSVGEHGMHNVLGGWWGYGMHDVLFCVLLSCTLSPCCKKSASLSLVAMLLVTQHLLPVLMMMGLASYLGL